MQWILIKVPLCTDFEFRKKTVHTYLVNDCIFKKKTEFILKKYSIRCWKFEVKKFTCGRISVRPKRQFQISAETEISAEINHFINSSST